MDNSKVIAVSQQIEHRFFDTREEAEQYAAEEMGLGFGQYGTIQMGLLEGAADSGKWVITGPSRELTAEEVTWFEANEPDHI